MRALSATSPQRKRKVYRRSRETKLEDRATGKARRADRSDVATKEEFMLDCCASFGDSSDDECVCSERHQSTNKKNKYRRSRETRLEDKATGKSTACQQIR